MLGSPKGHCPKILKVKESVSPEFPEHFLLYLALTVLVQQGPSGQGAAAYLLSSAGGELSTCYGEACGSMSLPKGLHLVWVLEGT